MPLRRRTLLAAALPLAACTLPANTGLRDWAQTASIAIDRPALLPGGDPLLALQQASAIHFYALAVLGTPQQPLTFREAPYAAIATRAEGAGAQARAAVERIGAALVAARDLDPAREWRRSGGAATTPGEDRARYVIETAGPAVRELLGLLSEGVGGAPSTEARTTWRAILAAIDEEDAKLIAEPQHIHAREVERRLRAAEDGLLRLMRRLPADAEIAARPPGSGAIALVVQP